MTNLTHDYTTPRLLALRSFVVQLLRWASVEKAGENESRILFEAAAREAQDRWWTMMFDGTFLTDAGPGDGDPIDRIANVSLRCIVDDALVGKRDPGPLHDASTLAAALVMRTWNDDAISSALLVCGRLEASPREVGLLRAAIMRPMSTEGDP